MSLIRLSRNNLLRVIKSTRLISTVSPDDEFTAVPNYPPILDLSYKKKVERRAEADHEYIKNLPTVEEKQIKLNMPRYYGFKCYMFIESEIPYNSLAIAQHLTRTHLIEKTELPEYYKGINVDKMLEFIKPQIEEALLVELEGYKRLHDTRDDNLPEAELEEILSKCISTQINRILMNNLSQDYDHLIGTQVDYDPRIESFWFAGGMEPTDFIKKCRRGIDWLKDTENDPIDRAIQYIGNPLFTLRNERPLNPIVPYSEATNDDLDVPFFSYDPRAVGIACQYQHGANVPGFWPGDHYTYPVLSYHKRNHLLRRNFDDPSYQKDALHRQGILASYGWLNAISTMLGFTTFNDITYPLVTQTVITNGKLWSIYLYQLNTLLVHGKNTTENSKRNICWALNELKLYEGYEKGKLVGFNDDVLRTILKCYANVPELRVGVNMTPYLSQEGKYIAKYEDDDKRNWLEKEYKFLVSNRPRHLLPYEIYHWEKIYKIDNKTRPMDARRRPFELSQKPYRRALNERPEAYIPRVLRPHLPKNKGRYQKSYFP